MDSISFFCWRNVNEQTIRWWRTRIAKPKHITDSTRPDPAPPDSRARFSPVKSPARNKGPKIEKSAPPCRVHILVQYHYVEVHTAPLCRGIKVKGVWVDQLLYIRIQPQLLCTVWTRVVKHEMWRTCHVRSAIIDWLAYYENQKFCFVFVSPAFPTRVDYRVEG